MEETVAGIITAIIIIVISLLSAKYFSAKIIAATLLTAIAFIYVGFSLKGIVTGWVFLESGVALVFYFISVYGISKNDYLLASGIILHGIWDICHYKGSFIGTAIPAYWPSYCFTVDIIDGVYFLFVFSVQRRSGYSDSVYIDRQKIHSYTDK